MTAEIDIVLPCYNSTPWLDGMMESIVAQDGPTWRIVARDDGSSDATGQWLSAWQARLGDARMIVVENADQRNLGIAGSFTAALRETNAQWILTADPDDIWLPGHLARVGGALQQAARELGSHVPIAVITDAAVIDQEHNPIASSYWRWARNNPRRMRRLADVAMESAALGSTMGVNRAVLDIALPIPREVDAQDWWLALVATAFGEVRALEEVTVLYRRHTSNNSGAPFGSSFANAVRRTVADPGAARRRLNRVLYEKACPQARAFVARYGSRLSRNDADMLKALAELGSRGPLARRLSLVQHRLSFASSLKSWAMLALC
jgi:glycosyltransferase involved in cell wall biosynthesis